MVQQRLHNIDEMALDNKTCCHVQWALSVFCPEFGIHIEGICNA